MTPVDIIRLVCGIIPPCLVFIEFSVFVIQSSRYKKRVRSESPPNLKYQCQEDQQFYNKIERLAVLALICNIAYNLCIILWYFYEFTTTFNINKIIAIIYSISLGLATLTGLLFYLNRFYISFRDTTFEPTTKFIKTFILITVIASIFIVIGLYLRITNSQDKQDIDSRNRDQMRLMGSTLLAVAWMTDVGLYVLLAYLFAKKLFLLVMMQQQNSITSIGSKKSIQIVSKSLANSSTGIDNLSDNQLNLINEIAKQTTLILMAAFCGIIIPLAIVLAAMFSNSEYVFAMYFVARGIVLVISPTILWLSFAFASKQYNLCCGRVHKLNYSCCTECAKKVLTNNTK